MTRAKKRSIISRILRRLPLPVLAIVVGLMVGTGVWLVVDTVQTRAVQQLFETELQTRLEQQARESLIRFNHFVEQYAAISRLLGNHKILAHYLNPLFWGRDELYFKMTYQKEIPDWLPGELLWQSLPRPSHILLIDRHGKIREEYQLKGEPLPAELKDALDWENDISKSFLTEVSGFPYLILIEQAIDESDNVMGALVLVIPVDTDFLVASQQGVSPDGAIVALLKADNHEILVSSNNELILAQLLPEDLSENYVVTSQSLAEYSDTPFSRRGGSWRPRASSLETTTF